MLGACTKPHSRDRTSPTTTRSPRAQFKTLKYRPDFPDRFDSLADARAFCDAFYRWYNLEHRHSGIGMHTPSTSTTATPKPYAKHAPRP